MTGRACGDCTLCCKVMAIEEIAKPAGQWCGHCKPGHGCKIHDLRPAECRAFDCLWRVDQRFGTHWKPSKSRIVLTTSEDGLEVRCDRGFPDAWRKEPLRREIAALAAAGQERDVTMLVIAGAKMVLVTPENEFDLGVVGPDQRILRHMDGNRVVGATVVDNSQVKD